jgi:hypothetical protein
MPTTTDHHHQVELRDAADPARAVTPPPRPPSGHHDARANALTTWLHPRIGAQLYVVWQTPELTPAVSFSATLAGVAIADEDAASPVRVTCAFAEGEANAVTLFTDEIRRIDSSADALRVAHRHGYITVSTR